MGLWNLVSVIWAVQVGQIMDEEAKDFVEKEEYGMIALWWVMELARIMFMFMKNNVESLGQMDY